MSSVGSFNPNAGVPVNDETVNLVQQMHTSSNIGVQSLGVVAESTITSGTLTEMQKATLSVSAQISLSDPTLSPADKKLVQDFIDSLARMPYVSGGDPMLPVGNAWLNVAPFVAVIQMLFEVTTGISQIKLSEAQMQIIMTRVVAEMARIFASNTEYSGVLQAEIRMNEAMKSAIQAGVAMTSMVMTGITQAARSTMIMNKTAEFRASQNRAPNMEEQLKISQMVDTELALARSLTESLPQCINALTNASVEARNAALEILKAQTEAASGKISKLADLLKGTIDTLRGDQSDLSQSIAKLLDNFLSAFSRQRAMGNG